MSSRTNRRWTLKIRIQTFKTRRVKWNNYSAIRSCTHLRSLQPPIMPVSGIRSSNSRWLIVIRCSVLWVHHSRNSSKMVWAKRLCVHHRRQLGCRDASSSRSPWMWPTWSRCWGPMRWLMWPVNHMQLSRAWTLVVKRRRLMLRDAASLLAWPLRKTIWSCDECLSIQSRVDPKLWLGTRIRALSIKSSTTPSFLWRMKVWGPWRRTLRVL